MSQSYILATLIYSFLFPPLPDGAAIKDANGTIFYVHVSHIDLNIDPLVPLALANENHSSRYSKPD